MLPVSEPRLTLSVARLDPRLAINGRSPSMSAITRWTKDGARDLGGKRVKLGVVMMPHGVRATTAEEIGRFVAALNGVVEAASAA